MEIEPKRNVGWTLGERRFGISLDCLLRPERERGIVSDEIAADVGLLHRRDLLSLTHRFHYT